MVSDPVMLALAVSVAEMDWAPREFKVAAKVCTPASAAVNV